MKKQAKKGFTIVELVIVIALIAILAAVLIPTFSNVINNAHESSDTMMVKNLNTILNTEEINGNGAKTMQDAIDQAEAGGYKVDKLTPTSSGDIVWDQKSNRFLLINAKGAVVYRDESVTDDLDPTNPEVAYKLWKITNNAVDDAGKTIKYSLYLAENKTALPATVEVGIDVGVNANVAVNFKSEAAREVIIRTNGGTLNVDAANATVSHFGEAEKVVIAAVADHSFHEYGKVVGNIEIAKGRVVMETGSAASAIKVTATKEEVTNGAKVVVDTKTSNVAVVVPAEVKDEIIAKGGSINAADDKVVTDTTVIANMDKFAGGLGTAESPYLIATAEQFMNIKLFENEMKTSQYYFTLINDIDLSTVNVGSAVSKTFNGVLNGNSHTIIANPSQAYMFNYAVDNVVIENLKWTLSGAKALVFFNRYGTTASLYDAETQKYTAVKETVNLTFKNIEINSKDSNFYKFTLHNCGLLTYCQSYIEILNAQSVGGKPDANKDSYYAYTSETTNCHTNTVIDGCNVNVNLSGANYNAVLLGGQTESINAVTVSNVIYSGTFIGKQVGVVFANQNGSMEDMSKFKFDNVQLTGTLIYTQETGAMAGITFANAKEEFAGAINNGTISQLTKDNTLDLKVVDSRYELTAATNTQVSKYVLTLKLGALRFTDSTYTLDLGEASTNFLTITIVPGVQDIYKAKNMTKRQAIESGLTLAEDWKTSNEGIKYQFVNKDGQWYVVVDYEAGGQYREFKNVEAVCSGTVYAYDQYNRILHIVESK